MDKAIQILEAAYEESEDVSIEKRYAIANANLARILLSVDDIHGALEKFELAFGLLPDNDKDMVALRAMCQIGSGIAHLHLGNLNDSISLLESALGIAQDSPFVRKQIVVLLAQALWAVGTDDFRETAKNHLLQWWVHASLVF